MHDGVLARHSYMHCCENWLWGCPVARLGVPKVPCFKLSLTHLLLTYPFRSRWALHQQWTAPSWVALVMPPSFFLLCLLVEWHLTRKWLLKFLVFRRIRNLTFNPSMSARGSKERKLLPPRQGYANKDRGCSMLTAGRSANLIAAVRSSSIARGGGGGGG